MLDVDTVCDTDLLALALSVHIARQRLAYSDVHKFNTFLSAVAREAVTPTVHALGFSICESLEVPFAVMSDAQRASVAAIVHDHVPAHVCADSKDERAHLMRYELADGPARVGTARLLCALLVAMRRAYGGLGDANEELLDLLVHFAVNDRKVPYTELVSALQAHGYGATRGSV
jgi:hypothetical protein